MELYFVVQGIAGVVTDRRGEPFVELIVACPGDFMPTEADSNMTLFNLQPEESLVMLDISSVAHVSSKDLQRDIGPLALVRWKQRMLSVQLNPQYIGQKDGFGMAGSAAGDLEVITPVASLSHIAEELTSEDARKQLKRLGIHIRHASNKGVADQLQLPLETLTVQHLRKDPTSPLYMAIGE